MEIPKANYKNIVIGCNLQSLIYCYFTETPFVYTRQLESHEFDLFEKPEDISIFDIKFQSKTLKSPLSSKESLPSKKEVWHKLFLLLNLRGLSLMPSSCASITINKNELKCISKHARQAKFNFEQIKIFDDFQLFNLPSTNTNNDSIYKVFDWIDVSVCTHEFDFIKFTTDFVNEIVFYPSRRSAVVNPKIKDIITISYLSQEQLREYDYSSVAVKFKVLYFLKLYKLRRKNWNKPDGTFQYKNAKIKMNKREIFPLLSGNIYNNEKDIEFYNNSTYNDIFKIFENKVSPLQKFMKDLSNI